MEKSKRCRFSIFVWAILVSQNYFAPLSLQAQENKKTQPAFQWRVTTVQNEVIFGEPVSRLKLKTDFGHAVIEPNQLRKLDGSDQVQVTTASGIVLKGELIEGKIELKTAKGIRGFRSNEISQVRYLSFAPAIPAKVTDGFSANGISYHLRVPARYDASKRYPAIVILHGSNMNAKSYVQSIASRWPDIGKRYILIGINGEQKSKRFSAENPAYNYTYVNFAGKSKFRGYPGSDRESPALVSETIEEIRGRLKWKKLFVGGHSQGGFLTYSLVMNYPQMFDGAFPIAAGMILQCEPTAYETDAIREAQRKVPVAIVHSPTDNVVKYSLSTYAFGRFLDDGFTQVKMFENDGRHMFMLLPVDQAIHWLEIVSSDEPQTVLAEAKKCFDDEEYRLAQAAIDRLNRLELSKEMSDASKQVAEDIQSIAAIESRKLLKLIEANKNNHWVRQYQDFQQQFRTTPTGKKVVEAYMALRQKHERIAERLFRSAQSLLDKKKTDAEKEEAYLLLEDIVDNYYASSRFEIAKKWLENREK